MALIEIRQLTPHTRLGLWRIDESFEGSPRARESHAVGLLLTAMMGAGYVVGHKPTGCPFVAFRSDDGDAIAQSRWHISISHTRGYAAILLSEEERVGIDIERYSDRVEGIARRFIRPDEPASDTDTKLLLWSAKEAVYKLFTDDNLHFFDMRMLAVDSSCLQMLNMKRNIVVDVRYAFTGDYVLTYVTLPA